MGVVDRNDDANSRLHGGMFSPDPHGRRRIRHAHASLSWMMTEIPQGVERATRVLEAMHKNYVILAHAQPAHVLRLVRRLDDDASTIWLHIDAAVSLSEWQDVIRQPAVRLVEPRTRCVWATWSIVAATITALSVMMREGREGYVFLLSGQTYPVRPNVDINRLVASDPERIRMQVACLPDIWPDNYQQRVNLLTIPISDRAGDYVMVKTWGDMTAREAFGWARRLVREIGWRRSMSVFRLLGRRRPDVVDVVRGGSQWWGMPWRVVADLLQHHEARPDWEDFFRWTFAPDELFFQTMVSDLYGTSLADRLAPSPTHVDWTPGDWDLPRVLVSDDVPQLLMLDNDVLFARKFEIERSREALDLLDDHLDRNPTGGVT